MKESHARTLGYSRESVFTRDGYRCRYCHAPIDNRTGVLEHAIPAGRPGSREPENIVTACRSCNLRKGSRTPEEAGMPLLPVPVPVVMSGALTDDNADVTRHADATP
jgi:5-methylcytosine-specific restriction endonuclease McrA